MGIGEERWFGRLSWRDRWDERLNHSNFTHMLLAFFE